MEIPSSLNENAVIGHFLCYSMLEDILKLWKKALLIDELQTLKVEQMGLQFVMHARDGLEDAKGEISTDHRSYLHGALYVVLQTVHSCSNDPLNVVRHLDIRCLNGKHIFVVILLD